MADNISVEYLLLFLALLVSVAMALAAGRMVLACALHLMSEGLPCTFHWRPVVFAVGVFWFWYLAPAFAESRAATTMIRLVHLEAPSDRPSHFDLRATSR